MRILNYKTILIIIFVLSESRSNDFALIHSTYFSNLLVKTAVDNKSHKNGLMRIKKLKNYNGMLFIYNSPQIVKFWMHETFIPLDIVFIDEENVIISVKEGIPLDKKLISSETDIIAVLEIPKGCAKKLKIKKGEKVFWMEKKEIDIKNIRYFHCLNSKEK